MFHSLSLYVIITCIITFIRCYRLLRHTAPRPVPMTSILPSLRKFSRMTRIIGRLTPGHARSPWIVQSGAQADIATDVVSRLVKEQNGQ